MIGSAGGGQCLQAAHKAAARRERERKDDRRGGNSAGRGWTLYTGRTTVKKVHVVTVLQGPRSYNIANLIK